MDKIEKRLVPLKISRTRLRPAGDPIRRRAADDADPVEDVADGDGEGDGGGDPESSPAENEPAAADGATIEGYGSVYYDGSPGTEFSLWPGVVERVMPGAFKRAASEDDIRVLFNHDANQILGRSAAGTAKIASDDTGLRFEAFEAATTVWRDVTEHLKRGDVSGSSISFIVTDERWFTEGEGAEAVEVREIRDAKIFDAGPVVFPAFEGTSAGLRASIGGDPIQSARESWEKWKGAGGGADGEALASRLRGRRARLVEVEAGLQG